MTSVHHFLTVEEAVDGFFGSFAQALQQDWESEFLGGFWCLNTTHPKPISPFDENEQEPEDIIFGRKARARNFDLFYTGSEWKSFRTNLIRQKKQKVSKTRGNRQRNQRVQVCFFFGFSILCVILCWNFQKRCYVELAGKELKKLMTLDDKILQMAKDLQRDNEIYDGLVCERQHQLSSTDIGCCVDSW